MTDVYIEDPDDFGSQPGAVALLRAEIARAASRLEQRIQASASDIKDETLMLARRAQHKINSRIGVSAAIAFGVGVGLGLLAAALLSHRSMGFDRNADR